ncbi:MAG: DUF1573 domain-containing protein [Phycisphaerae bacterium]|nr:DUF1573 domain-containing protein [Phycisphaerae bacterium]
MAPFRILLRSRSLLAPLALATALVPATFASQQAPPPPTTAPTTAPTTPPTTPTTTPPATRPATPPPTRDPATAPGRDGARDGARDTARPARPAGATPRPAIEEGPLPPVELDPPICDFGFVRPGDAPSKKVTIKNVGDKPLLVLAVQPSCKCTTVNDLVGSEIAPGATVELEASMRAQAGVSERRADIKIRFQDYERVTNVQLRMETSLPIRVMPPYINAIREESMSGRLVVESLDKKPFRVCSVHGRAPVFVGFDPAKDEPRNQYVLQYDARQFKREEIPRYLAIETDHPDCRLVDVFFRHEATNPVRPEFKLAEYRCSFDPIESNGTGKFKVDFNELLEGEPLTAIETTLPGATVRWVGEPEVRGEYLTAYAEITPPKDFAGILYAPITIRTERRSQVIAVFGLVTPKGHDGCLGLLTPLAADPRTMVWSPPSAGATDAKAAPKEDKPKDLAPVTGG